MSLRDNLRGVFFQTDSEEHGDAAAQPELIHAEEEQDGTRIVGYGGVPIARKVAPESMSLDAEDYLRLNSTYVRVLTLEDWPRRVEPNWLRDIFNWPRQVDVSVHYRPLPREKFLSQVRTKAARELSEIENDERVGNRPDFEQVQRYQHAIALQRDIEQGHTNPFNITLLISIRADSLKELNEITSMIKGHLQSLQADCRQAHRRQRDAFLSTLPYGRNYLADSYTSRTMQTEAAAMTFPFATSDLSHPAGVWYGVNRFTNGNVLIDRFKLDSPHEMIVGSTGTGKSYTAKLTMLRGLFNRWRVTVIDPEAECRRLCAQVGGQFITIGPNSPDKLNPLDFSYAADGQEDQLTNKIISVSRLIAAMMTSGGDEGLGMSPEQFELIQRILFLLYNDFGFTQDPRTQLPGRATPDAMPVLSDLRSRLEEYERTNEHNEYRVGLVRPIIATLGPYTHSGGGVFAGLFDERTTVDLREQFVVFNIQPISATQDGHLMALAMHSVLEYVWTTHMNAEQLRSKARRLLYIDEAHVMLRREATGAFLEDLLRRARKYNVGVSVITQSPKDFTREDRPWARNIFNATSSQLILRLKRPELEALREMLMLNDEEIQLLASRDRGEGMIFALDERAWVDLRTASRREHELVTTNADEVAAIEERDRLEAQMVALEPPQPPAAPESRQLPPPRPAAQPPAAPTPWDSPPPPRPAQPPVRQPPAAAPQAQPPARQPAIAPPAPQQPRDQGLGGDEPSMRTR